MTLVLDAGAFIALERGDRRIAALVRRERLAGRRPRTRTSDAIDAAVVALVHHDDVVIARDPDDLVTLAQAADRHVSIVAT